MRMIKIKWLYIPSAVINVPYVAVLVEIFEVVTLETIEDYVMLAAGAVTKQTDEVRKTESVLTHACQRYRPHTTAETSPRMTLNLSRCLPKVRRFDMRLGASQSSSSYFSFGREGSPVGRGS